MKIHSIIASNVKFLNILIGKKTTYVFPYSSNIKINDTIVFFQKNIKTGISFVDDLECLVTSIVTDSYSRKRNLIKANLKIIRQIQKNNGN